MPKKILVVDDDRYLVEVYRRALAQEEYEVSCAYDGKEGLEVLKAKPDKIDLIVLDLKMPKMAGDEFLKIIRRDLLLKDTKVLVMSSVLYRYKEIPRYDPTRGILARVDTVKEGLSGLAKRAEKTTKLEEGKLEMEEKPKARLEFTPVFGYESEKEADFERNVSEDLIRRVKKIFGEPYEEGAHKHREATVIEEKTKDIIAKMLKIDKGKLTYPSTSFPKDLGIAFIDAIPLRRRLEKEFKVKICWEDQQDIETLGNLIYCIEYLKMQARTKKERFRESDRKFWEDWKPIVIVGIILPSIIGLGMLIWELVVKKYFLK